MKDLTREDIEEVMRWASKRSYYAKNLSFFFMQSVCNMALSAIPRKFDPEDEATFPEKEGCYLVWMEGDDVFKTDVWLEEKKIWAWGASRKETVEHFMLIPIPPTGEEI